MAMTVRAQVVFPFWSGLPEDVMTNTLYIHNAGSKSYADIMTDANTNIGQFYEDVYSPTSVKANYVLWTSAFIRFYDMADPEPRVPTQVALNWTPGAGTAGAIPNEVSAVLSYQGARLAGFPQARRRGRIYIGGLANAAIASSAVNAYSAIAAPLVAAMANAADVFKTACFTAGDIWVLWSQADNDWVEITNGWVDNTPDTQRRRGVAATSRTLWS